MDAGTVWALIWVLSLVIIVAVSMLSEPNIDGSPIGVSFGIGVLCFVVSTVACVWVASGLQLTVT